MCSRGVWQLEAVRLHYSETGHSSRGLRFYFRHLLHRWMGKHPHINVTTHHCQYEEPYVSFYFANHSTHRVSLRSLEARRIEEVLDLYVNSESSNRFLRHGGPKVWTERRSIQGLWQPSLEGQLKALKWFHRNINFHLKLPKYSHTSLRLSFQAMEGKGRWGSEREFPKGWDQMHLKNILQKPFRNFEKWKSENDEVNE